MAHFAEIDANSVVTRVIVVANDDCAGGEFPESDAAGAAFCNGLLGGTWKQTSYNSNFRKHYAGVGYTYDAELDAFIAPQPFPSWILDPETADWVAPVPRPAEGMWTWNEAEQQWDEFTLPAE